MSLEERSHRAGPAVPEAPPFYGPDDAVSVTPARRAALQALEREFQDLLAPRA